MTTTQLIIKKAHLRYVTDGARGYSRRRIGSGFIYLNAKGGRVTDLSTLKRVDALVIPPAWKDVWICPKPSGHIQATGRDERGRKQYLYHSRWQEESNRKKFELILKFGLSLLRIRKENAKGLKLDHLARERVLATVTALLEKTHIRIGNEPYAEENHSFGLTTLQKRHIDIEGCTIHFLFPGKRKKMWKLDLDHSKLCKAIRKCQELPGQQLFKFKNGSGRVQAISSQDVNAYIKLISGEDFSAKDFRTWHATVSSLEKLRKLPPARTQAERKRFLAGVVKEIAGELNNTPAVCRRCYIHPDVIEAYEKEMLPGVFSVPESISNLQGLTNDEKEALAFLSVRKPSQD